MGNIQMNQNIIQGSWRELRGKLQKIYGFAQLRAEREYREIRASFLKKKKEVTSSAQTDTQPLTPKEKT